MNELELNFDAITIDNSILKSQGYKFNEGLLAQMTQFKHSPAEFVQTDIIHNEAVKHISDNLSESRSKIENALRTAEKSLKICNKKIEAARVLLAIDGTDEEVANSRLNMFYQSTDATIISSKDYVELSELMDMYFNTKKPFETGKDKKNEFPDAIALLTLKNWAEEYNQKIIAVSNDQGWMDFAETSDNIKVVSSLAEALAIFQPHRMVAQIIAYIHEGSLLEEGNHILDGIGTAILDNLESSEIEVEVDSFYHYEWDNVRITQVKHKLDKNSDGSVKVLVVKMDKNSIVLRLGAVVEARVDATLTFIISNMPGQYPEFTGTRVYATNEKFHTDILITLSGDFTESCEGVEVSDIEVLETLSHANFGMIDPFDPPENTFWSY